MVKLARKSSYKRIFRSPRKFTEMFRNLLEGAYTMYKMFHW